MAGKERDIYGPCDRAIQRMNRENLKDFSRMKAAKWDQVNVIRIVTETYRKAQKRARNEYVEVAAEAYVMMAGMCGIPAREARKRVKDAVPAEWVDRMLDTPDPVTLYEFNTEAERKAQRLAETIAGVLEARRSGNPVPRKYTTVEAEIDRALRDWTRQTGQYAINVTDAAAVEAMEDAGVERIEWVTQEDERVCSECRALGGRTFELDEVPIKHYGCRCEMRPVRGD